MSKYVYIPGEATTNGVAISGFTTDEQAEAIAGACPEAVIVGDPGE